MKITPEQMILAAQMLSSGLDFWTKFSAKIANQEITSADLNSASLVLNTHIAEFEKDVEAGKNATNS